MKKGLHRELKAMKSKLTGLNLKLPKKRKIIINKMISNSNYKL